MKTINIDKTISEILKKYSAFYAFNNEGFSSKANSKFNYKAMGAGLYCPTIFANELTKEVTEAINSKIQFELENNTPEKIITYHFNNHECYYLGDYSEAYRCLKDYGFSDELIEETWNNYCATYEEM